MKNDCIIRLKQVKTMPKWNIWYGSPFGTCTGPAVWSTMSCTVCEEDPAFVPELDFVMEKDGVIIGQNIFVRASIAADDGRSIPYPDHGPHLHRLGLKRQGYGKILLDYSLEQAAKLGAGAVCLKATSTSTARAALPMPPATASVITDCRKGGRILLPVQGVDSGVSGRYHRRIRTALRDTSWTKRKRRNLINAFLPKKN